MHCQKKTFAWRKMAHSAWRVGGLFVLVLPVLLAACGINPVPFATPTSILAVGTATLTPKSTLTPVPPTPAPRSLVVCLGEEPSSLYLYAGGLTPATWNILEAIYDGPIDQRGYIPQPVILQKLPSLADGDAKIKAVDVQLGDEVVDANGDLMTLTKDVSVYPAGCNAADCAVTWDGQSPLKMDQLSVVFTFLPGLTWSDGEPLKAADSVFSYQLAADQATPVSKTSIDRTASYRSLDDQTVEWVGKPGYLEASFASNLWLPLPQHVWGSMKAADLLQSQDAATQPMGWGPYVIDAWVKGDHITLKKNPRYFRAAEGLPKFDTLVYRFLNGDPNAGLAALQAGECDVLDRSVRLDEQLSALLELQKNKKAQIVFTAGPEWEHLDFGIKPASYDNGYDPQQIRGDAKAGDRPDFFGDVRTRQAFADCLDRQGVVDKLLNGFSPVADSYLPAGHPLFDDKVTRYTFNPTEGSRLLDEVGWQDNDNDPSTPRQAKGIAGIPDGTPLEVNYWTTQATLRQQVAELLTQSLAQCGIRATPNYSTPSELFAEGPDGPVFGRKFDLVQFSWESSKQPQCFLFTSQRIPSEDNHWLDANITGYSNPALDAACAAGLRALPGQPEYASSQARAQEIFTTDLPVIPLYFQVKIAAARPDLCGFNLDPSARSDLPGLEAIDYGKDCQ